MAMFPAGPIKVALVALVAITVAAVLAACGGGQEATSSEGRAQPLAAGSVPTVAWAPASITMSANPGARQDIPLTLTAGMAMSNVTVGVPTTLRTVISITPTSLGNLKAGQPATVTVTVAPSASESLRTLTGSITVRAGFASVSSALPISISLVAPETLNGIVVPPEPPKELNDLTLAGFDLNANGVRDDVERLIAREFGRNSMNYGEASRFSRAERALIAAPTALSVANYTREVDCSTMSADDLDKVTFAHLNTKPRRSAFALAYAGAVGQVGRDCK